MFKDFEVKLNLLKKDIALNIGVEKQLSQTKKADDESELGGILKQSREDSKSRCDDVTPDVQANEAQMREN